MRFPAVPLTGVDGRVASPRGVSYPLITGYGTRFMLPGPPPPGVYFGCCVEADPKGIVWLATVGSSAEIDVLNKNETRSWP